MTKGLLLKSFQGDAKLPDIFTTLVETNDKDADIEIMCTSLLHQASLYDGKDQYLKTNIKTHYTNIDPQDSSLEIHCAAYRAPNPEARLPDSIFDSLDPTDK